MPLLEAWLYLVQNSAGSWGWSTWWLVPQKGLVWASVSSVPFGTHLSWAASQHMKCVGQGLRWGSRVCAESGAEVPAGVCGDAVVRGQELSGAG